MDDLIKKLIRPPRRIFSGFDWKRTDKLKPTGDAAKEKALSARLSPRKEENDSV